MRTDRPIRDALAFLSVITFGALVGMVSLEGSRVILGIVDQPEMAQALASESDGGADLLGSKTLVYNARAMVIDDEYVRVHKVGGDSITQEPYIPPATGKAINVNLDSKVLTLYEDGEATTTVEVLSIGREGTPWETPAGDYRIRSMEENHFSSIGRVYMPYSMQFFGNYFIHGWPYHPNGTPVSEGYSGGCIRLSQPDAKLVYEFAEMGVEVHIERENSPIDLVDREGYYYVSEARPPNIDRILRGQAYLIADLETGEILFEKNKSKIVPIASVTKLLSMLTSLEVVNQYQKMRISRNIVATEGYAGNLLPGQYFTLGDLNYPLMLESSNDAAEAIAQFYGRDRFVDAMNNKSKSIGLVNTKMEDASGLSANNVSTAEDLFLLAQYIFRNKQYIYDVSRLSSKRVEARDGTSEHEWYNNNRFVRYRTEGYLGGKGGYTDAAQGTLVALFEVPLSEFESRKLVIVILGNRDKYDDTLRFIDFLKDDVYYGVRNEEALPL